MRASTHIAWWGKTGDPNSTAMSSVPNTPPTLPPDAPPLAPLVANTYETGNEVLATSKTSGGPNGAHRFVAVAFSAHIVVDTMRVTGRINSKN